MNEFLDDHVLSLAIATAINNWIFHWFFFWSPIKTLRSSGRSSLSAIAFEGRGISLIVLIGNMRSALFEPKPISSSSFHDENQLFNQLIGVTARC
jgi:hypothetical protein